MLEIRQSKPIFYLFFHTLRIQRTIKLRDTKAWNTVPDDLKRINFYHFKLKFKQFLLNYNQIFRFFCFNS